jgi:DNA-binding response OmpR family regulator
MSSSRYAGMHLEVLGLTLLPVIPFWRYDLIVLEQASEGATAGMVASIRRVRALSSAPLVVLTRHPEREVMLAGLNAGADAVTSLLTQEQVLLAHWGAMLQRWKAA